ncbi:MAG: 30S ribosomal protein S16 [Patescibacteria group bacterium]
MLTIRLQRVGKKKVASYRLVISEKARDTQDRYLELLGTFDPHAKENQFKPIAERIQYWIGQGAQTSPTVHNLLVNAKVIKGKKEKSVFLSKKRSAKLAEKASASAKATADKKATDEATAGKPEVAPAA